MDITSLFLTEPLLLVRWGARELGHVDPSALTTREHRQATILLGGRSWGVDDVDWRRRVAWVTPSEDAGRSSWRGAGTALSPTVCGAMRSVLLDEAESARLTARAAGKLLRRTRASRRGRDGRTLLARDVGRNHERWWTFAGGRANAALATGLESDGLSTYGLDDLSIGLHGPVGHDRLVAAVKSMQGRMPVAEPEAGQIEGLKFGECLPRTWRSQSFAPARLTLPAFWRHWPNR
jgi:ATP-dependent Lhr-like helicase